MPLIARRRIGPPHTLFKSSLQSFNMDYPAITPLPPVFKRDMHTNPSQGGIMTELKLRLYLPHGQPSRR